MPVLQFGPWLPDQAALNNPGVVEAINVFPAALGYIPAPDLAVTSNALDNKVLGAIQAVDRDGNVRHFSGDSGKLYEEVISTWTDRSKLGGYSTSSLEKWEFARWKNKLLATNFTDVPQQITFGGANFSDLTTDFNARHIAVVRDFVVVGNTSDATDGAVPDRVRWSAIDDETDWTVDPATLSDFQDLKTGSVERIIGDQFGVIFQADAVWRMTFIGSPTVFQFDNVVPEIGALSPGCVEQVANLIYFLSQRGFFVIRNGTTAQQIGSDAITSFVLNDIDNNHLKNISTASDQKRVFWAYPGTGNVGGLPNKIVIYDRSLERWSILEREIELLWESSGAAMSLEDLDNFSLSIDTLELSLDSDAWKGGKRTRVSAFDDTHSSGFFDNTTNLTATITSAESELTPGRNTHLKSFRHVVDGGTVTAQVGTRENQADAIVFGSSLNERPTNRFTTRSNARYHQFKFTITGDWSHAIGMQIEPEDVAQGARRGR